MNTKIRLVSLLSLFCAGTLASMPALSESTQSAGGAGAAQVAGPGAQSPCADTPLIQTGLSAMALWKVLHDPVLNAGDGLGDYVDDLSVYHEPGNRVAPVTAKGSPEAVQNAKDRASRTGEPDLEVFRAFFHNPALHPGDDLGDYVDDHSRCC